MVNRQVRFILLALSGMLPVGCAANRSQPQLVVTGQPASSQPIGETATIDVQQLTGQIVAGVQAELNPRIETAVKTTLQTEVRATGVGGDVTGYRSEFGVGATVVVSLVLVLALVLSHRREVLRIKQGARHVAAQHDQDADQKTVF